MREQKLPGRGNRNDSLVENAVLTFNLNTLQMARHLALPRSAPSCVSLSVGERFEPGFFGRVPAPEIVPIQVHPVLLSAERTMDYELFVAHQDDLRGATPRVLSGASPQ